MKKLMKALQAGLVLSFIVLFPGPSCAYDILCGDCHGTPPVNADNCMDDARGLHGTHYNYSSANFPKTVADYGKCAYCHAATNSTAPTATHNNNAFDFTSIAFNPGTKTCSNACHQNEGSTAVWGNYTTPGITLSCNSCHDDASASIIDISGAHAGHLGSAIDLSGIAGATALDNGNHACWNCHPDNTSDGNPPPSDDGGAKFFQHASDGTNVAQDNAAISLVKGTDTRGTGDSDSCANVCHENRPAVWSDTSLACDSCHYYAAVPNGADNDIAAVGLSCSHGPHFDHASAVCGDCHVVPTDSSHVTALPVTPANASVSRPGMTYNENETCSNTGVGCHGTGTTLWTWCGVPPDTGCATCHYYPASALDWAAGDGHASRSDGVTNRHMQASGWDAANDTYPAVTADANRCGLCHYGGTHNDGTIDVQGSGHAYCGGGNFVIDVDISGLSVTCYNADCHSGKTTPNWY